MGSFLVIYILVDVVHPFLREAKYKLHYHDIEETGKILTSELPTAKQTNELKWRKVFPAHDISKRLYHWLYGKRVILVAVREDEFPSVLSVAV